MAPFLILPRQISPDDPVGTNNTFEQQSDPVQYAFTPTEDQKIILYIIAGYTAAILLLWNMPIAKILLAPFKLLTVGLHEFCHAFVGCLTCARIESIEIDPDEGGATQMIGGNAMCTLPAGYLGSSLIGAILVMCGFNIFASKVASIFLGTCLLFTLWWAKNWLTRGIGIAFIGVMLLLWYIAHGAGLKYFVLFMGVMSCLYCLWDILDDLVFRKAYGSDATKFAELYGLSSRTWGVIWFFVSVVFFAGGILVGLVAFKETAEEQERQVEGFGWR
ncbi:peptidase M50B-like-domain-containing protein [Phascolomyces articulosus]|uniref:Peptidase M50B-like-domain-containing protein n=1 Tax=Phascolomyces articulosus TaxID=60185 RepID=A0AAD5JZ77_9FUNG|nr:peptidase M50B-like-domain-containing protein [Phascolomyces articulosus]